MTQDSDETLWVSDPQHVIHMYADHNEDIALQDVGNLTRAHDGGVYATTEDRIWHLRAGTTPSAIGAPGVVFSNFEGTMSEGADGALWIGTRKHGVARLHKGRIETLPHTGERDRSVTAVFVDREGTTWAGATSGLHRFRKPMVQPMPSASGHLNGVPGFVFVDSRENVWLSPGDNKGASRMNPDSDTWQSVKTQGHDWVAIGEDQSRRIWLSNTRDIGYVAGRKFVAVRDAANAPVTNVWSFKQDRRGQLWALAEGVGVYRVTPGPPRLVVESPHAAARFLVSERFGIWVSLRGGGVEQHVDGGTYVFRDENPTRADDIARTIIEDGDAIWIGTFRGLKRWRHRTWTYWTREHGLPGDGVVEEIGADQSGHFWIMTGSGILMLPRAQLDATRDGAPRTLSFARIGVLDGVASHPGGMRGSPRLSADRRGRLYFTTLDSVVIVDPSAVAASSLAPPIVLESVTVDNRPIDLTTTFHFVEPSRLQFDYTSLSLRSPENARFRYRLEGYDRDWIEAGGQRHVTYGTLRPGSYRFRVIGAGSEGVWTEEGATFAFHITPVFWRRWWFRMTLLAFGSLVVAGLYRLRVRQLTRQFDLGLEARVSERTRIARDLHDTLLQTFQGVLIHFQAATNLLPGRPDDAKRTLERVLDQAARAITEGRDAVQALRSPTGASDDLAKTLSMLGEELAGGDNDTHSATVRVNVEGNPQDLRPILRDDVYRIASEAVRNAMRHAQAQLVQVDIHYDERSLRVRIRDDGKGIDAKILEDRGASGHWGLPGMRERAELVGATLDVRSRLGWGTEVDLSVPASKAYAGSPRGRRFWSRGTKREASL